MEYKENRKRALGDSDVWGPNSKLARVDSTDSLVSSAESTRVEPDPEGLDAHPPEVKRIEEDLLGILDDADPVNEPTPGIQGLDSVIKSFEEEILAPTQEPVVTLDASESRPDLGFLLEASDDELGLPPSFASGNGQMAEGFALEGAVEEAVTFGGMLEFEDRVPSYDSFELGMDSNGNNGSDYVALGGLFDHNECEPAGVSEFTWRTQTLPTL